MPFKTKQKKINALKHRYTLLEKISYSQGNAQKTEGENQREAVKLNLAKKVSFEGLHYLRKDLLMILALACAIVLFQLLLSLTLS